MTVAGTGTDRRGSCGEEAKKPLVHVQSKQPHNSHMQACGGSYWVDPSMSMVIELPDWRRKLM
jgi:hypothetical protein